MKTIKYFWVIVIAGLFGGGCNLLDIQPQNAIIPKTIEDFQSILVGGYPIASSVNYFNAMNYMSDDAYVNLNTTTSAISSNYMPFYSWAETHQVANAVEDPIWGRFYQSIFCANTVIDALKGMNPPEAQAALYETIYGEAHALRAYCYFYLANLYGDVYSTENLSLPCVPMPLSASDVSVYSGGNKRETIDVVWGQIESDLETATSYLKGASPTSEFRFTYAALQALRARVYLFMGEWDKSIAAATEVIDGKSLFNMNTFQTRIDETTRGNRYVFADDYGFTDSGYYNEVLLFAGGSANNNPFYYWTGQSKPDPELYELCMRFQPDFTNEEIARMEVVDFRSYIYCSFVDYLDSATDDQQVGPTSYHMYGFQGKKVYFIALKLSEVYVTRAEAYMRRPSPDKDRAVADLNTLLRTRMRSSVFVDLEANDFATNQELIDRILEERRLETALDSGLRWFDLRRFGKPALTHYYRGDVNYTLSANDPRYVLQIPVSEQIASPDMPLNPR